MSVADAGTLEMKKNVYRVDGFSCASCASTFENNVKRLNGVVDAKVNFGASKITVYGETTLKDLEKAGAFEKLKISSENSDHSEYLQNDREPFWKKYFDVLLASAFVAGGITAKIMLGEDTLLVILLFALSILTGGYALFKTGLVNLFRLQFDMKTLMTVAVIGAAIIGEWMEGAIVVILFAISEALERYSMDRARRSIRSLMDIAPKEALIRRGGQELLVRVEDIRVGDRMIVKPGQKNCHGRDCQSWSLIRQPGGDYR